MGCRWPKGVLALAAAVLPVLQGCTSAQALRPVLEAADRCIPTAEGRLDPRAPVGCRTSVSEIAAVDRNPEPFRYSLFFAEFDDQGWPFDGRDGAGAPLARVLHQLRDRLKGKDRPRHRCVSADRRSVNLLLFVHGWKHNAAFDDSNVVSFRKVLREVAIAECLGAGSGRDVIGVYVGWRGGSLDLPEPLESLSFWDRKSTAADVAQGSVRELFARLDAMVDEANAEWRSGIKPVRMMVIGHSFGGHILLTGLGGSVLRNIAAYDEAVRSGHEASCRDRTKAALERDGDMVVLVNPAIEGARYDPLHRIASAWNSRCYRAPMLVAVTSEADIATRKAFPAGRWFSTLLESYPGGEHQARADVETFGHHEAYLTHELRLRPQGEGAAEPYCRQWNSETNLICSIRAEMSNQGAFADSVRDGWDPSKARSFCAGAQLVPMKGRESWSAPVLNIRAEKALIADHNRIYDPRFVSFLRELYMDTLIRDVTYRAAKVDTQQCPAGAGK